MDTDMELEPVEQPIDGVLDLHTFQASEVKDLLSVYLGECRKLGLYQVRIIHGKGTGSLKRTVQSVLQKLSFVKSFRAADEASGGWGATIVELREAD